MRNVTAALLLALLAAPAADAAEDEALSRLAAINDCGGCDLTHADLSGRYLAGANIAGVRALNLTQRQVEAASGDAATLLPAGLAAPKRWQGC